MYIKDRKYSDEQIATVYRHLKYSEKKLVTERLGCHRNHVYRVFKGDYYDEKVINECLKVIAERVEYQASVSGVLEKALGSINDLKMIASL
ncbi:MAG: hypothetical protein RIC30_09555 [Marinoscillum sp.]|uniref:hypothetical protein n=1 Tax=Marinoscillum sp. TaxID=2024838 RepID=UPI00330061B7